MTQPVIAIIGGLLLIGFIFFAFRQGTKVTPDDREDRRPSVGTGNDYSGWLVFPVTGLVPAIRACKTPP